MQTGKDATNMTDAMDGNAASPAPGTPIPWQTLALYVISLAAIAWAGRDSVASLAATWDTDGYGHGWLVLLVSGWLFWRSLRQARSTPQLGVPALLALPATLGLWFLAEMLGIQALAQGAVFLTAAALAWLLFGTRLLPGLLLPTLFPLIAVSAWDVLMVPLQEIAVVLTSIGVRMTSIPAFIDGKYISIPEGRFVIETMCAGLRYLLAGLTIAILYGALYLEQVWRTVLFVAITTLWSIFLNGVRIVVVIATGHLLGMDHPWVEDHGMTGWILFGAGLLPLIMVGRWLEPVPAITVDDAPAAVSVPGDSRDLPLRAGLAGAAVVLAFGFAAAAGTFQGHALPAQPVALAGAEPCGPADGRPAGWTPRYADADRSTCQRLSPAALEPPVAIFTAQYFSESDGRELIGWAHDIYDPEHERLVERGGSIVAGRPLIETVVEGASGPQLVWHSHRIGDRWLTGGLRAKLARIEAVLGGGGASMVVAVGTPLGGDPDAARRRLQQVLSDFPGFASPPGGQP